MKTDVQHEELIQHVRSDLAFALNIGYPSSPTPTDDSALEAEFNRRLCQSLVISGQSDPSSDAYRTKSCVVFASALALLTFGRLDVACYVLEVLGEFNLLNPRMGMWKYANVLSHLFPLPDTLNPLRDRAAVRVWFHQVLPRLRWNPAQRKFELDPAPSPGSLDEPR